MNYSHIKIKRWTEFINSELSAVIEKTTKVKFSDNIVLLEAAARNDITEGLSLTVCNLLSPDCHFNVTRKTVRSSVTESMFIEGRVLNFYRSDNLEESNIIYII